MKFRSFNNEPVGNRVSGLSFEGSVPKKMSEAEIKKHAKEQRKAASKRRAAAAKDRKLAKMALQQKIQDEVARNYGDELSAAGLGGAVRLSSRKAADRRAQTFPKVRADEPLYVTSVGYGNKRVPVTRDGTVRMSYIRDQVKAMPGYAADRARNASRIYGKPTFEQYEDYINNKGECDMVGIDTLPGARANIPRAKPDYGYGQLRSRSVKPYPRTVGNSHVDMRVTKDGYVDRNYLRSIAKTMPGYAADCRETANVVLPSRVTPAQGQYWMANHDKVDILGIDTRRGARSNVPMEQPPYPLGASFKQPRSRGRSAPVRQVRPAPVRQVRPAPVRQVVFTDMTMDAQMPVALASRKRRIY